MSPDAGSIPAASTILLPREKLRDARTSRTRRWLSFSLLFFSALSLAAGQPTLRAQAQDFENYSRVILTLPSPLPFSIVKDDSFLQVRIPTGNTFKLKAEPIKSRFIKSISWNRSGGVYIVVIEGRHGRFRHESFQVEKRRQLVIDFYEQAEPAPSAAPKPVEPPASPEVPKPAPPQEKAPSAQAGAQPAGPAADTAKGVRTIVIDPGHGGIESGAKGKFGALEKDVTLAISLRLKALIEKNLAYRVELTRDRDLDVPLESRAAIANNNRATLFISVHANGSPRRKAKGSETFFLSLNATDEESRRLAYLENNSAQVVKPMDTAGQDEIQMILWDMAQSAYLKRSQRLAELVQEELNALLGTANRGIKQAPFKVLTGAACPAVLVEVAFISNPDEEKELVAPDFQDNVAQAIYRGLLSYVRLSP
jgi:N-acetylmuramoyl-L-alanine amidase